MLPRPHIVALLAALSLTACVTPHKYVRVATATAADFEAVKNDEVVWYQFQPGDVVPFNFLYFGALQGGAADIGVKAKTPFYLVARKNAPMSISYDGQNLSAYQLRSVIAVVPRKDGQGGEVGWMTYLGEAADPQQELDKLFQSAP